MRRLRRLRRLWRLSDRLWRLSGRLWKGHGCGLNEKPKRDVCSQADRVVIVNGCLLDRLLIYQQGIIGCQLLNPPLSVLVIDEPSMSA